MFRQLLEDRIAILELRQEGECVSFQSEEYLRSVVLNLRCFEIPPNIPVLRSQISKSLADVAVVFMNEQAFTIAGKRVFIYLRYINTNVDGELSVKVAPISGSVGAGRIKSAELELNHLREPVRRRRLNARQRARKPNSFKNGRTAACISSIACSARIFPSVIRHYESRSA